MYNTKNQYFIILKTISTSFNDVQRRSTMLISFQRFQLLMLLLM
jgi:hypothetical protein